jgi:G3E family GTPase
VTRRAISARPWEASLLDTLRLDGVVTLVDAKHADMHLDEVKPEGVVNEALEQVAFADRLVLNKTDLVSESELLILESRVRTINQLAHIQRAEKAVVDLDFVLGVGGFDLERVQEAVVEQQKPKVEEEKHGHEGHSHSSAAAAAAPAEDCAPGCDDPSHDHSHNAHSHGEPAAAAAAEEDCAPGCNDPSHSHSHGAHVHDDSVTSVALTMDGEVDLDLVNDWLGMLLNDRWQAGAYTRPPFSSIGAVSDTKYTLEVLSHPLLSPTHPPNSP